MVEDLIDRSKIGKKSKRKGKTYERRCAKILIDYTGINFRSTPASGGFNKQGGVTIREELFCGDLICDNPNFRFCVEAKNRQEFSITALLKNPETAAFSKWWYQCIDDAKRVGLKPLMFFKPNRQDDCVVLTHEDYAEIFKDFSIPMLIATTYSKPCIIKLNKDEEISIVLPTPVIIDWKQFISCHDPKLMFRS